MRWAVRWTVRSKLVAIVLLTATLQTTLLLVDLVQKQRVRADLAAIERDYLPLVDLGNDVERQFVALIKSLEDAVAAQDLSALAATRADEAALLARLEQAPQSVNRTALHGLERTIDAWYARALDVSRRLVQGESGLTLTDDIARMQGLQRAVEAGIQSTVMLDRSRLAQAFQEARRLLAEASLLRMLLRIASTLAVLVIGIGLARQIVRSLAALGQGFERFGRGEFEVPVEVRGDDELSDVAKLANRMAKNLDELNLRLRARQAELERTNREIEAFSYSVSHDLRAPLRSIDGFSAALLEDYGGKLPPEGQDYLRRVRAAAQRMAQLIDDILRLSRVTRAQLHRTRVDVTQLARSVGEELARAEPERTVALDVADGLAVRADAQLLRIVLENLLGNAWKFTGKVEEPRVEVRPAATEGLEGFSVRDNGAGFEMSQAQKLFTPFQRLHGMSEFPGTGIGLATVQRIVHSHGGRVWAEGAVNRGATFFVALPRDEPDAGSA